MRPLRYERAQRHSAAGHRSGGTLRLPQTAVQRTVLIAASRRLKADYYRRLKERHG